MSETLPKGWVETIIDNLGTISTGNTPPKNDTTNYGNDIPFVKPGDLENGGVITASKEMLSFQGAKIARLLNENAVMVTCIGNLGRVGITGRNLATNQQINSIQFIDKFVIPKFGYFRCFRLKEWLNEQSSATTLPIVNKSRFSKAPFPLPPLNEQKRIVAKLDAIIPRIDSVKARLDKVPTLIKGFRQSVLTAAVTGKLTEKWRVEHPDVESADVSVKSIYNRRIKECKTTSQKAKVEGFFSEVETEDNSLIPETWQFIYLNKICESFQYGTSSKSSKTGKVAVLRMGNLQNGKIDWSNLAYTSNMVEIKKHRLKKNTVLFNRTNSPGLVGKTAIYLGEQEAIFAGYLIKVNNFEMLDSHYLNFALNTNYAKAFCNREKTDGVSQSNINAQKLGRFEIPLPPLGEQKEIVRQVNKLFDIADKLEAHYQNAKYRIDKLSQSVLAKAFRGELVPQDPNDEPAEKLLERIMEEKAKMAGALKLARKKTSGKRGKK